MAYRNVNKIINANICPRTFQNSNQVFSSCIHFLNQKSYFDEHFITPESTEELATISSIPKSIAVISKSEKIYNTSDENLKRNYSIHNFNVFHKNIKDKNLSKTPSFQQNNYLNTIATEKENLTNSYPEKLPTKFSVNLFDPRDASHSELTSKSVIKQSSPRKINKIPSAESRGNSKFLRKTIQPNFLTPRRMKHQFRPIEKLNEVANSIRQDLIQVDKSIKAKINAMKSTEPTETDDDSRLGERMFSSPVVPEHLKQFDIEEKPTRRGIVFDSKRNAYYPNYSENSNRKSGGTGKNYVVLNNLMKPMPINSYLPPPVPDKPQPENVQYVKTKMGNKSNNFRLKKDMITYEYDERNENNIRQHRMHKSISLPFKIESPFEIYNRTGKISAGPNYSSNDEKIAPRRTRRK